LVAHVSNKDIMREEGIHLPAGYWLETDADTLILRRPDDSIVAVFSARGAEPSEIERAAVEDRQQRED
jgi:hypothetical protein